MSQLQRHPQWQQQQKQVSQPESCCSAVLVCGRWLALPLTSGRPVSAETETVTAKAEEKQEKAEVAPAADDQKPADVEKRDKSKERSRSRSRSR
jgi:hypothetical protein